MKPHAPRLRRLFVQIPVWVRHDLDTAVIKFRTEDGEVPLASLLPAFDVVMVMQGACMDWYEVRAAYEHL